MANTIDIELYLSDMPKYGKKRDELYKKFIIRFFWAYFNAFKRRQLGRSAILGHFWQDAR